MAIFSWLSGYRESCAGNDSISWKHTRGIVVASDLGSSWQGRSGRYYRPEIAYTYLVAGKEYKSSRISFPNPRSRDAERERAFLHAYPVDRHIDVYFDPEHPDQACLRRGFDNDGWNRTNYIMLGMSFLGVLFLVF